MMTDLPTVAPAGHRDHGRREYLEHTGSALFAVPPGVRRGGFLGDTLFAR